MGGRTTVSMLGPGVLDTPEARLARFHALAVAALTPRVTQEGTVKESRTSHDGEHLQTEAVARAEATRTTVTSLGESHTMSQDTLTLASRLHAAASGSAQLSPTLRVDGGAMAEGATLASVGVSSETYETSTLYLTRGAAVAEVASGIRGGVAGAVTAEGIGLSGAMGAEAEGALRASAQGAILKTPTLFAAQGQALAEAAARIQASAQGSVQVGNAITATAGASADAQAAARAGLRGEVVASDRQMTAQGEVFAEAATRVSTELQAGVNLANAITVDAALANEAAVGAKSNAGGMVHLGVDQYGMPSFGIGAKVEAASGAWARTQAKGRTSILGIITLGASGSVEGLAGLASGVDAQLSYADGAITIGGGAKAAAGVGMGAGASVTVGLGKLPGGLLQAVGAPILPLPGLIGTTLVRGFRALTGAKDPDPTAGAPDLGDLPKVIANNFTHGISLVGQGAVEAGEQLLDVGKAIGNGAVAVGSFVVDGVATVGKAIGTGAVAVGSVVVDGMTTVGKAIGDGASAVGSAVVDGVSAVGGFFGSIGKGIASIFGGGGPAEVTP